jgi:signal transduction histidine kinase
MDMVTPSVGGGIVQALLPEADGSVWVGTSAGGLMRIWQGVRSSVTRLHGLPDDSIFQFLADEAGQLWCGSPRGLFRVSLRELNEVADGRAERVAVFTYGRSDGLADFPFSNVASPANCRARDRRFWFATAKGAVAFRPDALPVNREVPPVVIEDVLVNGSPVGPRDGASFSSRTEQFQFQFTALSFTAPDKVRFRHRLDGADEDWVDAGNNRRAVYSRLKPGAYRFQVIAANNDGVWNTRGAAHSFTVQPVFWQTRWFPVLVVGFLMAGLAGAFRFATVRRLRRRLARLHEQHALEQERTRIAQDIHDELGASLTQIGMLANFAGRSVDRPNEVAADLKKITDTAHEAVRAMDAIVWAINPQNNSLENFAAYVSRFAESFLPPAGIRFRFDAPADLPAHALGTEQRHQLFLVVREALNNVVRHAQAREVWLRLAAQEGRFVVSIEDDGRGLPATEPDPGSDGLANMRQRIESIGGIFTVDSQPAAGTRIKIQLPLAAGSVEPSNA